MNNKKWTKEEEQYLFSQLKKNPSNITKCLKEVGEYLGRTYSSCQYHWYVEMRKKPEYSCCFFTVGSNKTLVNAKFITKTTQSVKTTDTIFKKILKFLHINNK